MTPMALHRLLGEERNNNRDLYIKYANRRKKMKSLRETSRCARTGLIILEDSASCGSQQKLTTDDMSSIEHSSSTYVVHGQRCVGGSPV